MNSESALKARRGCSPFSPVDLDRFKSLLIDRAVTVEKMLGGLTDATRQTAGESVGGGSSVPVHLAELASETFEQELSLDFMARSQEELREIQDALERIEYRCYGLCTQCGLAIPTVRLDAMPTAEFCIDCKSRAEQE
jgi:RNA polymerase-binding transcription factor DksA